MMPNPMSFLAQLHDQYWCEAGFPRNAARERRLPVANLVVLRFESDEVIGS